MSQLVETLQRGAADGSIAPQQAVSALALRLESLGNSPGRMLEHLRQVPVVVRVFPDVEEEGLCELLLTTASILETWGDYAAAKEALQLLELRGCAAIAPRAACVSQRIAFGETGRVEVPTAARDDMAVRAGAAWHLTRAFLMWTGGAGAAVDHVREALLALEHPEVELMLPLIVAASSTGIGEYKAASAALDVFQSRLARGYARADPALVALFHALRGRVGHRRDPSLAEADFRAADSLVDTVPHSLPWAYVKLLQAEALMASDLDAADRLVSLIQDSPIGQNFVVRRLLRAFGVARAMTSGQHDAVQLAIQQQAETQELLRSLAGSPDEVAAVLRYWQRLCDVAAGAESLASQRHSSALLDRFLVISVMSRSPSALHVLRKAAAAHCIGRGLGWTDSDLRYVRSYVMFQALPSEERVVITLPPFPPWRRDQLDAVVAVAALVAEAIERSRGDLLAALRAAGAAAPAPARAAVNAAISLASMQDMRRLVDFHVNEFTRCVPSQIAVVH